MFRQALCVTLDTDNDVVTNGFSDTLHEVFGSDETTTGAEVVPLLILYAIVEALTIRPIVVGGQETSGIFLAFLYTCRKTVITFPHKNPHDGDGIPPALNPFAFQ